MDKSAKTILKACVSVILTVMDRLASDPQNPV